MASSKEYFDFISDQLSGLRDVTYRRMMGEYIIYYKEKIVGGIYDNRLLVKPVAAAVRLLPEAPREVPYEGTSEMLLVEDVERRELLESLFFAMYDELPPPRKRK
ncbi:MAG: TfoX/Sxy family protein [Clostridia bacterium]|nr:TfoX/Sxy family protein [Clostridia bacterium]